MRDISSSHMIFLWTTEDEKMETPTRKFILI
jgi:hypothetical protein